MLPTLIHWGQSERGMMKDQPPFRLQKIQSMLSTIQKQRRTTKSTTSATTSNNNVSISLIQSLSYRRNQLKYLNPRLSMQQLRLGNDEDIKGAATQFERCVETYLRKQNIPFLQEWQQKKITRAAGMVNDPPSPGKFVLFCCVLWCVQYEDSAIRILHLNLVCLYVIAFITYVLTYVPITSLSSS